MILLESWVGNVVGNWIFVNVDDNNCYQRYQVMSVHRYNRMTIVKWKQNQTNEAGDSLTVNVCKMVTDEILGKCSS